MAIAFEINIEKNSFDYFTLRPGLHVTIKALPPNTHLKYSLKYWNPESDIIHTDDQSGLPRIHPADHRVWLMRNLTENAVYHLSAFYVYLEEDLLRCHIREGSQNLKARKYGLW